MVYRLPNQSNVYNLFEDVCLTSTHIQEREFVVLGDFNTNVTGNQRCKLKTSLNSCLDLMNWTQIINGMTRISTTSSSTIDLILVSDTDEISQSGVLDVGVSDHCMIYCTRKLVKFAFNKHNSVKIRSMKNNNKGVFQMNLLSADWSSVLSSDNVIDAWERFKSIFINVVNNISPIKEVRIKQRTEPWINAEISQSINDRDRAFKVFKGDKSEQDFSTFKDLRNKTQTLQCKEELFSV